MADRKSILRRRGMSLVLVAWMPCVACERAPKTPEVEIELTEWILDEEPLYSSHNEEVLVRAFFGDRRRGFFLDVGCFEPVRASNTYYLEKHLRWCGIAVDALEELAPQWEEQRPRSSFFAFLVSNRSDQVSTFYRSELADVSSAHKDWVARREVEGDQVPFAALEVPTITLTKLLDDNGVRVLDFVSMDIEGWEPAALEGFDIDRFQPALICLEVSPKTRERVHAYFKQHEYVRIERFYELDPHNEYYVPRHPLPRSPGGPMPHCPKNISPTGRAAVAAQGS